MRCYLFAGRYDEGVATPKACAGCEAAEGCAYGTTSSEKLPRAGQAMRKMLHPACGKSKQIGWILTAKRY